MGLTAAECPSGILLRPPASVGRDAAHPANAASSARRDRGIALLTAPHTVFGRMEWPDS